MPAEEAKPDNWPAGTEVGGKRAVTMIYALKQETEGPESLLVNSTVQGRISSVGAHTGVRSSSISPAAEAA